MHKKGSDGWRACAVCAQLWPYLAAYITAQAAPQVDPMLEANRPAWMESIKLVKCALSQLSITATRSNEPPLQAAYMACGCAGSIWASSHRRSAA